jgi:para-nitrobenzyl esterase
MNTTRRSLLAAGGLLILPRAAFAQAEVVADTTSGKVKGVEREGVKAFKGIPYGADTSGKNRFMPPKKPQAWAGVRDATDFGFIAPQVRSDPARDYVQLIGWDRPVKPMSEDCLNLNVWTRGLRDGAKRPVMVSFHGGGWVNGSAMEAGYDGHALVRFGDVVSVTVNHRLGALGYIDLMGLRAPPEFAQAGVAGALDMVLALEWVRDNIEAFGGDPNCVMIYGQSGGGSKVATLMAMPAAKGLFHRAAIQSSSAPLRALTSNEAEDPATTLAGQLGWPMTGLDKLQQLLWQDVIEAQAHPRRKSQGLLARDERPPVGFAPVLTPGVLPRHPFAPTAPDISADVPLIVGNCIEDASMGFTNFSMNDAYFRAFLNKSVGESHTAEAAALYDAETVKSPFLRQARLETDRVRGQAAIVVAERKAAQGRAPVYKYIWTQPSPGFGGKFGATHGIDVGPTFHSYDAPVNGGGAEAKLMADRTAAAWIAFARTGNPNTSAIPSWPAYEASKRATMMFDGEMKVENDPRRDFRLLWARLQEA